MMMRHRHPATMTTTTTPPRTAQTPLTALSGVRAATPVSAPVTGALACPVCVGSIHRGTRMGRIVFVVLIVFIVMLLSAAVVARSHDNKLASCVLSPEVRTTSYA